jgi:N-acyl-D-aspartate/D-glutamate deacylase
VTEGLDLVVRGGTVVDGTGAPPRRADVGVAAGRVVRLGQLDAAPTHGARVVDAAGQFVCPGFVDIHSHSDFTLLLNRPASSAVRQGVTTEVVGNCGISFAPTRGDSVRTIMPRYASSLAVDWRSFGEYLDRYAHPGLAENVAHFVGHGAIRLAVLGMTNRPPDAAELAAMVRLLEEALDAGAVGLSVGLEYPPGNIAARDEILALCRVVARHGRLFAIHMRNQDAGYLDAVAEALDVAERSGAGLQISHLPPHTDTTPPGAARSAIALLRAAQSRGVDVSFDVHPYLWGLTFPTALLPPGALEGGPGRLVERLDDPAFRQAVRDYPHALPQHLRRGHPEKVVLRYAERSPGFVGRSVAEIAAVVGGDAYDAVFHLLRTEGEGLAGMMWIVELVDEEDLRFLLRQPDCIVASDGIALTTEGPLAEVGMHPRCFGWSARLLGRYVRDEGLLSLPEAIAKVTGRPAAKIGLRSRGVLTEGAVADLVVFDLARVRDNATYERPNAYPDGFTHVFVNGAPVVWQGKQCDGLPGTVLRPGPRAASPRRHEGGV